MNPSYGGSSSRTSSTGGKLRPRVGRLISGLDEGDEVNFNPATAPSLRIASPLLSSSNLNSSHASSSNLNSSHASSSNINSSHAAPMPARHLPRTLASSSSSPSLHSQSRTSRDGSPSLSLFFSDSWSAIQGKASEMLGNTSQSPARSKMPPPPRPHRRKPSASSVGAGSRARNTSAPPAQWGVNIAQPAHVLGMGTTDQREADLRTRKRQELLAAGPDHHQPDSMGRFKRRTSDARPYESAPPGDHEDRDALVYIHHVKPDDTLAGISIKYNCKDAMIRRTNRLWTNDRPQVRKVLLIPADACAVKGKKLNHAQQMDLLTGPESQSNNPFPTSTAPELPSAPSPTIRSRNASISTTSGRPLSSQSTTDLHHTLSSQPSADPDHQWTHDSWVLFPNAKEPTELARLSRRNLAYFPPARRKSQCYSDLDTPSTSLDLLRAPTLDSPALSPLRETAQRPRRGRKLSNATNGYFPSYLSGPGGVGTMGKNIKSPGPGQDGLNKLFASHLPNVAPPPNQQNLYLPDIPLYSDDPSVTSSLTPSGTQTPSGLGLDNVGGAIESWARKFATKALTALDAPEPKTAARSNVGVPGRGPHDDLGDLIEMADQFEIGDDDQDEEERGRQGSGAMPKLARGMSNSASFGLQPQDTLRERARNGTSAGAGKMHKDD